MIKVLICDDQQVVCEGLRAILSTEPGIEVVGIANNGEKALDLVETLKPELVLMDLKMPIMNGIEATRLIHERFPAVRVLVMTSYGLDEWVLDAIRSGASGYVLKDTPRDALVETIEAVAAGKIFADPDSLAKSIKQASQMTASPSQNPARLLNERELAVLLLLARGLNNAEISQQLRLPEDAVRKTVSNIFARLGVADRTQAAVLAIRSGLGS